MPGARVSWGAFERWGTGPDVCGMSISGVSSADPLFVPFINPSAGFDGQGWRFSSFYSNRFCISGLSMMSLALSSAGSRFLWSLGLERFGNDRYREELSVVGVGLPLTSGVRMGLTVRLHGLGIQEYGSARAPGFDLGWSSEPVEGLRFGAVWKNFNRPRLGVSRIPVPHGLVLGVEGEVSKRLTVAVEGERVMGADNGIRAGFRYGMTEDFLIRTGFRRETGEYSLGATVYLPVLRVDYAFSIHPVLGITHFISLSAGSRLGGPRSE